MIENLKHEGNILDVLPLIDKLLTAEIEYFLSRITYFNEIEDGKQLNTQYRDNK